MPVKVVDASVLAAWCFREPRAAEALELLRNSELHSPILLAYELTSVARRKAVEYPDRAALIGAALKTALSLPLRWHAVDHPEVWRLALETRLSTYDSCYLHLAEKLGSPFADL